MRWTPLFPLLLLLLVPIASADYTLQFQALTNSPADGATVYIGVQPVAPTATPTGMQIVPTAGTINVIEIYDYSGTAGTNQEIAYYLRVNNATDYLIAKVSAAASERVFTNSSMNVAVAAGDTIILKRVQPTWTTNPLTNIVGGYVLIDTPDETNRGYTLYGMALSNTPADNVENYIGGNPVVPSTTEGINKIFIPTRGSFTIARVADYSGTAGTAEAYSYSLDINSTEYLIESRTVAQSLRFFNNTSMNIPVQVGNYLQFKRQHPAWVTNPATNVVGATAWVDLTDIHDINDGYPTHTFALTHTPADGGTVYYGYRPIAPSTTANTNKMYIRQAGVIKKVGVYSYSGTAGTGEPWAQYIVVNNTEAHLIANISIADNERMWINTTMNITVNVGDYVEMKSEQPAFATNPATTTYGGGFYLEYENELPVASFTANTTAGSSPLVIQFTNTSETAPTGWDWFWTCVENSTVYHFSMLEDPVETFDNGHFDVQLNVTNASGWSTSAATRISVSDTGGYSGFTQQDIYLSGFYTITWTVVDSTTNVPIAVVAISDAVTGQANSTTAGIGSLSGAPGLHYINFVSTGYTSKQVTYVYDGDASYTVQMVPSTAITPSQPSIVYIPQQVRFQLIGTDGAYLSNVFIQATPINFTAPANWTEVLLGISPSVGIRNTTVYGTTASDGSWVAPMLQSFQYQINLTRGTDVNYNFTLYPQSNDYKFTIPVGGYLPIITPSNIVSYSLQNATINESLTVMYQFINMTYNDGSLNTDYLTFRIYDTNNTMVYSQNYTGATANAQNFSYVQQCNKGQAYTYGFQANQSAYGWVNQSSTIKLISQVELLANGPAWITQWFAIAMIVIFGTLFMIFSKAYGLVGIPLLTWSFQYVFGFLPATFLSNVALLCMLTIGVLVYIRQAENKIQ